jgi:hypothetical protein
MPLVPSFSISQSASSPNLVTATDTSTGSDVAIVARHIYFQTAAGTYLVESGVTTDYNIWALANTSQTFDILQTDQALNIIVNWVDINGNTIQTTNQLYCLREFNKQFLVYLGQLQAIRPGILQDFLYAGNLTVYYAYIKYANKMITVGADIANSQNLLNKATYMMINQTKFFGN